MLKVKVNKTKDFEITFEGSALNSGKVNGKVFALDFVEIKPGSFHVIKDHKSYNIELVGSDFSKKTFVLNINGRNYQLSLKDKYDELLHSLGFDTIINGKALEIKAPMPGLVLDVRVAEGDMVKKDDTIFVLEAMKMENILKSPIDGVVKKINAKKGMAVEKGQLLMSFV